MTHHKKPRLNGAAADHAVNRNSGASANEFSGDVIAIIFGYFPLEDIMRMRRVCKKWREAATKTIVPMADFSVYTVNKYNAMTVMTTALPHLQQLSICCLPGHKYSDGEDPYEARGTTETTGFIPHDINIISNFRKLRTLDIFADLNGRYPALFSFPLLEKLAIHRCGGLKWDLEMLEGLPSLKEIDCIGTHLTGNIRHLRVLKNTLEKVQIHECPCVEGNFMDLADFPRLKYLSLGGREVTGDIRDIRRCNFPALEKLFLPETVAGGMNYQFQSISDVPSFMQAVHLLMQRTSTLFDEEDLLAYSYREDLLAYSYDLGWDLSASSPDWYDYDDGSEVPKPPFHLQLVQAGSRLGWVWCSYGYDDEEYVEDLFDSCEINWLDPEPSGCSYEAYIEELQRIEERIDFYRGYRQPPTLAEYNRLCEENPRYFDNFAARTGFAVALD